MLRNVIAEFIDAINERELDIPFLYLLPEIGFFDVHYTHGSTEFGKDFIAKRKEENGVVQYAFQNKAGDIDQGTWRKDVLPQLVEATEVPLVHPNFDSGIPLRVVIVTTGQLKGQAKTSFHSYRDKVEKKGEGIPPEFWGGSNLVDYFLKYGMELPVEAKSDDFRHQSSFFKTYSQCLDRTIRPIDVELFSQDWVAMAQSHSNGMLRASLESEILARRCLASTRVYEALIVLLARQRLLYAMDLQLTLPHTTVSSEATRQSIVQIARQWITEIETQWLVSNDLLALIDDPFGFVAYPVHTSRVLESCCLLYFLSNDKNDRDRASRLTLDLVTKEPGACRIVSDRYAVSVVAVTMVLKASGYQDEARLYLCDVMSWVSDRYEEGAWIPEFEADEFEETWVLLGSAFDFGSFERPQGSFLATTLCDLSGFLGNHSLYLDLLNDCLACGVAFTYWQPLNALGACFVESQEVLAFPNSRFSEDLGAFEVGRWAEHRRLEGADLELSERFGSEATVELMLLLRDRYFLDAWASLTPAHTQL